MPLYAWRFHKTAALIAALSFSGNASAQSATQPATAHVALEDVGATRVTLNFEASEPQKVFAALATQAGLSFEQRTELRLGQNHNRLAGVDLKAVPFWEAMVTLSERSPYVFHGWDQDGNLMLAEVPAGVQRPPAAVNGPFLVTISHIACNTSNTIEFAGRASGWAGAVRSPPCLMYFYANAEPRVKPVRWYVDSVECVTDSGQTLEPLRIADRPVLVGDVNSSDAQLRFETAVRGATSLVKLKLSARFVLERTREIWEIDKVLERKGLTSRLGGFNVAFDGMRKYGAAQYGFSLTVERNGEEPAWSEGFQTLLRQRPTLTDAKGFPLKLTSFRETQGDGNRVRLEFMYTRIPFEGGEPVKLAWSTVADTTEVAVPLEFRNVPMP